jgi:hypothetical protein
MKTYYVKFEHEELVTQIALKAQRMGTMLLITMMGAGYIIEIPEPTIATTVIRKGK